MFEHISEPACESPHKKPEAPHESAGAFFVRVARDARKQIRHIDAHIHDLVLEADVLTSFHFNKELAVIKISQLEEQRKALYFIMMQSRESARQMLFDKRKEAKRREAITWRVKIEQKRLLEHHS